MTLHPITPLEQIDYQENVINGVVVTEQVPILKKCTLEANSKVLIFSQKLFAYGLKSLPRQRFSQRRNNGVQIFVQLIAA